MRLEQLYLVILIDRYGTLSEVAKKIGMAQSTISYNIRALEDELGVELFHKEGIYLKLTALGRKILHHIEIIERAKAQMYEIANKVEISNDLVGQLNIGYGTRLCGSILVDALIKLRHRQPNINASMYMLNNQSILKKIAQKEYDAGIIQIDCVDEAESLGLMVKYGLEKELLFSEEMYFIAKSGHPLFQKKICKIEEVMAYQFITSKRFQGDLYMRFLQKYGNAKDILFVPDYASQHKLIEENEYITFMPYSAYIEVIKDFKYNLRKLEIEDFSCEANIWWVYNTRAISDNEKLMIEELQRAVKESVEGNV